MGYYFTGVLINTPWESFIIGTGSEQDTLCIEHQFFYFDEKNWFVNFLVDLDSL
jgi:uncharacterized protein YneR